MIFGVGREKRGSGGGKRGKRQVLISKTQVLRSRATSEKQKKNLLIFFFFWTDRFREFFLVPVTPTSGSRPTAGSSGHWIVW